MEPGLWISALRAGAVHLQLTIVHISFENALITTRRTLLPPPPRPATIGRNNYLHPCFMEDGTSLFYLSLQYSLLTPLSPWLPPQSVNTSPSILFFKIDKLFLFFLFQTTVDFHLSKHKLYIFKLMFFGLKTWFIIILSTYGTGHEALYIFCSW